jgi:cell division protein FtsB
MPKPQPSPRASIRKKLLIASLTFLFLVLIIASFFGDRGLIEIYQVGNRTEQLSAEVERLQRLRDELLREIEELKTNPEAVREKARELGLVAADEQVILK